MPAPGQADLEALRSIEQSIPDGTRIWVPPVNTNLVGSIEVDDLEAARMLQQFSLSPRVEGRVCSRSSTSDEGERVTSRSGEWR